MNQGMYNGLLRAMGDIVELLKARNELEEKKVQHLDEIRRAVNRIDNRLKDIKANGADV